MAQDRNPQSDFDLTSIYNEINESFRVRLGLPSQEAPAPPILTQEQISQRKRILRNFLADNFVKNLVLETTPPNIDELAQQLKEKFTTWQKELSNRAQNDIKSIIQSTRMENLVAIAAEAYEFWLTQSGEISLNTEEALGQVTRWSITLKAAEAASKLE